MGIDINAERDRRLYSWMNGIPAPPLRVSLFPTNVCNLKCRMCGIPNGVQEGRYKIEKEFKDEEWLPIIEEGAKMGILDWWICGGGEPLMRRELTMEIIRTIKHHSPSSLVALTTNGTRFTEEMLRELVTIGLDKMQFSIDAPDAASHDWVRRKKGTFEKVTWAIRRYTELKREMGKKVPWITVSAVLNGRNYYRLEEYIGLAERIGIQHVEITPLRVTDETRSCMEKGAMILNDEQKQEAFRSAERAKKLAEKRGIRFEFEVKPELEEISERDINVKFVEEECIGPLDLSKRDPTHHYLGLRCYEPWYTLSIDAYGNPGHCVTMSKGDPNFSLREHTLHEFWYGRSFVNARSRLMENKLISCCSHCTVVDMREKVGLALNEHVRAVRPDKIIELAGSRPSLIPASFP